MAEIGVGMLGYAFMGKAHSHALKSIGHMTWPAPLEPRLVSIAGRSEAAVSEAAERYGFESWTTDWHEVVADDRVGLFDNCGPNALHAEPTIAAAEAGKHVICEKPLGMNADESYEIWQRVEATGVKHACGFNYRFVPAVRLARRMLEAGELGEIRHFRGRYLQDWLSDPAAPKTWRLDSAEAGTGAIGDLGTHVIDLARYLVGEIEIDLRADAHVRRRRAAARRSTSTTPSSRSSRSRAERSARSRRPASRSAAGTRSSGRSTARRARSRSTWSASTSCSSHAAGPASSASSSPSRRTRSSSSGGRPGTSSAGATRSSTSCTTCSPRSRRTAPVGPDAATLEDGYRASEVADAILRSAASGRRETISYR